VEAILPVCVTTIIVEAKMQMVGTLPLLVVVVVMGRLRGSGACTRIIVPRVRLRTLGSACAMIEENGIRNTVQISSVFWTDLQGNKIEHEWLCE